MPIIQKVPKEKMSSPILLKDAELYTKNYRDTITANDTKAHLFNKEQILNLLAQDGCAGLRIYYSIDIDAQGNKTKQLVVVGVKEETNSYTDILPDRNAIKKSIATRSNPNPTEAAIDAAELKKAMIIDRGSPCPNQCDGGSSLSQTLQRNTLTLK